MPHANVTPDDAGTRGAIEVKRVSRVFGKSDPHVALSEVSLSIPSGQFVALVGASGCGKTTLLNMLAGLLAPSSGVVTLSGKPPSCPNFDIGYMFARPALLPWRRVLKNVELGLQVRRWPAARRRERAREMLELVGIGSRERSFPNELSHGMRQRVALARTLAPDPFVLLMDEPFGALDARTKLVLQQEFLKIWETTSFDSEDYQRRTVVFVTHDLSEAILLADRVVVMHPSPGRIAGDHVIDLPRPRADDLAGIMFTEQFRELHENLFHELEGALGERPQERAATPAGTRGSDQ